MGVYGVNKRKFLPILCCLVYFVSYVTRINYQASISEIITDLAVTKQLASIAVTGSFITYGIGQIISGIIGDKLKPQNVIFAGIIGTSLINIAVFFAPNIYFMNVIWCFNGFFQALLWPPLVRIISENIHASKYENTVLCVSWSSYFATIIIYIVVPIIISFSSWRLVFIISAVIGLIFSVIWLLGTRRLEPIYDFTKAKSSGGKVGIKLLLSVGIVPMLIAIIMQGMLRDGITTWMPSYIAETFNLGNNISILTTAILPIFSIFGTALTTIVSKKLKNELLSSTVFFGSSFLFNVIMAVFFAKFIPLDIFSMAMISVCMHGVNLMLISNVPRYFAKYGKVSTISGIMNAATYLGSALSTYVFAIFSDKFGWNFTVISWAIIAFIGFVLCLFCIKIWKEFTKKVNEE